MNDRPFLDADALQAQAALLEQALAAIRAVASVAAESDDGLVRANVHTDGTLAGLDPAGTSALREIVAATSPGPEPLPDRTDVYSPITRTTAPAESDDW